MKKTELLNLLNTPLRDLKVSLDCQWLNKARSQVSGELRSRGLYLRPHFWVSDEWFCADETTGVAVPFFLLNRHLYKLEKQIVGWVDGATQPQRVKILRHEIGHVVDTAYGLRGNLQRRRIFGDPNKAYPEYYIPKLYSTDYVKNLGDGYAQAHPDEDFAETFAVWLNRKSEWRRVYKNTLALEKLEIMDCLMNQCRRQKPKMLSEVVDPLSGMEITLEEHYKIKCKNLGLKPFSKSGLINSLLKEASDSQKTFQHQRSRLIKIASTELKQPRYKLEVAARIYLRDLGFTGRSFTQKAMTKHFLNYSQRYFSSQGYRVYL